tara:strand:- start:277 stop:585 length:309 start_codon:yes stop_codon:yes gene_type:complete
MDEREILFKYLERQTVYILYKDFWTRKFSNSLQDRFGISQYRNRQLTKSMVFDDEFWAALKTSSTYRYVKKEQAYKTLMYSMRRDAYDLVRKDALANAKSDD